MRGVWALLVLVGCAAPQPPPVTMPAEWAVPLEAPADPRARIIRRAEGEARQVSDRRQVAEIARVAAEGIVAATPDAPRAPARKPRTAAERAEADAWERSVQREERQVMAAIGRGFAREARAAQVADRDARQDRYCRSLAQDVVIGAAPLGELLAAQVTGLSPRGEQVYYNCQRSFSRTNAYLDR